METYDLNGFRQDEQQNLNRYMSKTFAWMFIGLLLTFVTAIFTAFSGLYYALFSSAFIFVLTIAEVVLVIVLSSRLAQLSTGAATGLFLGYALMNGVVFSTYFVAYGADVLIFAFLATAVYFGVMAVYGSVTQKDLSGWGPKLYGGLIALLIISVLGMFFGFGMLDFVMCIGGLVLFMLYTAYDTQKIKAMYYATGGQGNMAHNLSIMGALQLYLDFINIFIRILSLMGRRRRN